MNFITIALSVVFIASCSLEIVPLTFSFPSDASQSVSPSERLIASYFDPGRNADGTHDFIFRISDNSGNEITRFVFGRSVAGAWAPESDLLYVNNYEGSNLVDCLVLSRADNEFKLDSLTQLLMEQVRSGVSAVRHIIASPDNSHFYLTCDQWMDRDTIEVGLDGYVDVEVGAPRPFSYRLRFDVPERAFQPL